VKSKAMIQPFATKKIMADDGNEEETGSQPTPGNQQERRDPRDHKRQVPIGATETIRTVCKERLQRLVTTFSNMELEIKVIGSPEQQRR
jgi:hypothetical protein